MPRNDNHYINLALSTHGTYVLMRAMEHLENQESFEIENDRALWELQCAKNRVQVDVSYHRKQLEVGPRRWVRRNDYKSKRVAV